MAQNKSRCCKQKFEKLEDAYESPALLKPDQTGAENFIYKETPFIFKSLGKSTLKFEENWLLRD